MPDHASPLSVSCAHTQEANSQAIRTTQSTIVSCFLYVTINARALDINVITIVQAWLHLRHMHLLPQHNTKTNSSSFSQQQKITQYYAIHNNHSNDEYQCVGIYPIVSKDDDRDKDIGPSDGPSDRAGNINKSTNKIADKDANTQMSRNGAIIRRMLLPNNAY